MSLKSSTWTPDWCQRLQEVLRNKGFETLDEFLKRCRGEPYVSVVKRIAPWVVAMQIVRLQMLEAKQSGALREAAMDSLARELKFRLPHGWADDVASESNAAGAFADTGASIVVDGDAKHLEGVMSRVYRAMKSLSPPMGWQPSGPDDPLIREAFNLGWPASPVSGA